MFRLNPAPFCLLDEVDAPLDEANQLRLANMVQQMSSATQFIAITHNRITMEKAGQLIGVTMREPGFPGWFRSICAKLSITRGAEKAPRRDFSHEEYRRMRHSRVFCPTIKKTVWAYSGAAPQQQEGRNSDIGKRK